MIYYKKTKGAVVAMIDDIIKYCSNLTVLYAEDDPSIQTELRSIFEIYFKKVYVGNDGQEGLALFLANQEEIDLIISDIQMPNMDGLEMITEIRKSDQDIPVLITTAFNDQDYFIRSIDCRVFRYLIKPIKEAQMEQAFFDVGKFLFEKREYEAFKVAAQKKEVKDSQDDAISKISDVLSTPNIIFQNNVAEFYSTSFKNLFSESDIDVESITPQMDIFENKEGFFTRLEQYKENPINGKVSITTAEGNKIFRIERKEMKLENNDFESEMFLLEDITAEEALFSIF